MSGRTPLSFRPVLLLFVFIFLWLCLPTNMTDLAQTSQFTLTVNKNGTGTGAVTSSPAGINCGSDCTQSYNSNTK
jgi:hypothetical protein